MMPYPFDCPKCDQRFWEEASLVYDEEFDDHICWQCHEEDES